WSSWQRLRQWIAWTEAFRAASFHASTPSGHFVNANRIDAWVAPGFGTRSRRGSQSFNRSGTRAIPLLTTGAQPAMSVRPDHDVDPEHEDLRLFTLAPETIDQLTSSCPMISKCE